MFISPISFFTVPPPIASDFTINRAQRLLSVLLFTICSHSQQYIASIYKFKLSNFNTNTHIIDGNYLRIQHQLKGNNDYPPRSQAKGPVKWVKWANWVELMLGFRLVSTSPCLPLDATVVPPLAARATAPSTIRRPPPLSRSPSRCAVVGGLFGGFWERGVEGVRDEGGAIKRRRGGVGPSRDSPP